MEKEALNEGRLKTAIQDEPKGKIEPYGKQCTAKNWNIG